MDAPAYSCGTWFENFILMNVHVYWDISPFRVYWLYCWVESKKGPSWFNIGTNQQLQNLIKRFWIKKREILTWTKFNTVTLFTVYSKLIYIYRCTCKRQVSVYADLERGSGHPTPPLWKIQIFEIYVIKLSKIAPPPLENKDIPRPFPHPPGKNFWIRPWSAE